MHILTIAKQCHSTLKHLFKNSYWQYYQCNLCQANVSDDIDDINVAIILQRKRGIKCKIKKESTEATNSTRHWLHRDSTICQLSGLDEADPSDVSYPGFSVFCKLKWISGWNGCPPRPHTPMHSREKKTVCIKHGTEGKGWNFMSKKGKMEGMEKENVSYPMCWREKNRFEEVPESEMLTDPLVSLIPTFRGYKSHAFTKGSASIKEDFIFFSAEQRLHSLHSDVPSNTVIFLYS